MSLPVPGSPPRVRGKVEFVLPAFTKFGITPARAGKSQKVILRYAPRRDHPRACGEKTESSTECSTR